MPCHECCLDSGKKYVPVGTNLGRLHLNMECRNSLNWGGGGELTEDLLAFYRAYSFMKFIAVNERVRSKFTIVG